jgi:hypothetical protein
VKSGAVKCKASSACLTNEPLTAEFDHDVEGMTTRFHRGAVVLRVNESDIQYSATQVETGVGYLL